ncbi:general substrate transporter [Aaosphaeria arxii CBS 175.79]|uniref:General substrate transporter n=1 Tax=Aaosphaeria arxii CBS 175.79 TaxID=1450172 RepID=A0A6A5Y795_9PLEO|nr:general substrate transporter [Aaosphaeria arxii CBS 175.79]KAF2021156.1 general substrate transporter [Aaosphaeria arxii CBS 175.79]
MATGSFYNFLLVFFVALGSFTYGFNSAIIGSVLGLPSFFKHFDLDLEGANVEETNRIIGATNGMFAGGGMIGCLLVPWIANKLGRLRTIQIVALLCVVSAAIQAGSVHIAMFLVGRFFNGIGVGMVDVAVPLYQAEVSPAKTRGRMVGSHGFLIVCGYAGAGWVGYGCYFLTNEAVQWRLCLALQMLAPLLLLAGSPWVPESPRWLCAKGKNPEALAVLEKMHSHAMEEFYQIHLQLELEQSQQVNNSWIEIFRKKSYRKRLIYGFFVQCIAQSTGVLVVNNYQVLLYNGLGLYNSTPLVLYACYNSWAAFMNWVNSIMLDRWGRIRIMTVGLIGCALSLSCFTAMVAEYGGTENKIGNGFGVFFLYLFVTFYGGTMDASSYVYCAEIFPTTIRAQGLGFSVMGLFMMTLIYTQTAPTAFAEVGWRYYLVFITIPLAGVWFLATFLPETRLLSLEEISNLFGDEVAVDLAQMSEEQQQAMEADFRANNPNLTSTVGHESKDVSSTRIESTM